MKTFYLILTLVLVALSYPVVLYHKEMRKLESDDPRVWEDVILSFQNDNKSNELGEILFLGSSSIRFWRHLEHDMAPMKVVKRGFGGAKINDINHYYTDLVGKLNPKAIVFFAGTNDIAGKKNDKSPMEVLEDFRGFMKKSEQHNPACKVFFLSITPTTSRWEVWPLVSQVNEMIKGWSLEKDNLIFIDATNEMLNHEGFPRKEFLWWDGTHLNRKGYQLWAAMVKESLENHGFLKE